MKYSTEGSAYSASIKATMQTPVHYAIEHMRFGWAVKNNTTGQYIVVGLNSLLKAKYVVATLTGKVDTTFMFGEI